MYTQHLSSLEFFTYAAFFAVVVVSISALLPGRKPPVRTEPYSAEELGAHDSRLPKYFLAGGAFPGMKRNIAAMTTPKNDAYVRNWSDERWRRYTA